VGMLLPNQFWLCLQNKLGNQPSMQKVGEDTAIPNAVEAITYCLEEVEPPVKTCLSTSMSSLSRSAAPVQVC